VSGKIITALVAGGLGVALGIYLTRSKVRAGWEDAIHSALGRVGLAGTPVEAELKNFILPRVS
jgi:hypothetical protein